MPYNLFFSEVYSTVMATNPKVSLNSLSIIASMVYNYAMLLLCCTIHHCCEDGLFRCIKDHLDDVASHGSRCEEGYLQVYCQVVPAPLLSCVNAALL